MGEGGGEPTQKTVGCPRLGGVETSEGLKGSQSLLWLGTKVPLLQGCLLGLPLILMLTGPVLAHFIFGAVGYSDDSKEARSPGGRVVPGRG